MKENSPSPLVMDMPGIVCDSCDSPIPEGQPYLRQTLSPDLAVIVCTACGPAVDPGRT